MYPVAYVHLILGFGFFLYYLSIDMCTLTINIYLYFQSYLFVSYFRESLTKLKIVKNWLLTFTLAVIMTY